MNVLIVGATGFVGGALIGRLLADGHSLQALVRNPARAREALPDAVGLVPDANLGAALSSADAVVNLAGEPILPRRWTPERKALLRSSRVDLTRRLVESMAAHAPRVFVSVSAVGFYGDRKDEELTERSSPGDDFLARLCVDWEAAARGAEALGTRVVQPRLGVVLGAGGALGAMLPPFRIGLGGPYGPGTQYMPWVHLDDVVGALVASLGDDRYAGPLNLVGPAPSTNRDFARTLGSVLGRPAMIPAPAMAMRLALGEAVSVLLGGQRAVPERLQALGYAFRFPSLEAALRSAVGR